MSQWEHPGQQPQEPWPPASPPFTYDRQQPFVQRNVQGNVRQPQWQEEPAWNGNVPSGYQYGRQAPQPDPWQAPPREDAPVPQRAGYGRGIIAAGSAAVVLIAVLAGAVVYLMHKVANLEAAAPAPSAAPASTAPHPPAEPETKAGVRSAATAFYDLYAASQWTQAWAYLAPATQRAVSAKTWTAVHEQCTDHTAGLARTIKSVTLAGGTAVVDETVAGALGKLGTVSDAWDYSAGRWGLDLPASSTAVYSHGSVKADVAAAKAAGECAS